MLRKILVITLVMILTGLAACDSKAPPASGGQSGGAKTDGKSSDAPAKPDPVAAKAAFDRAQALVDDLQIEEAGPALDEAIRLNPDYAEAYALRGKLQVSYGNADQGLADIERAIELKPNYDKAYLARATYYETKFAQSGDAADQEKATADLQRVKDLRGTKPVDSKVATDLNAALQKAIQTDSLIKDK